MIAAKNQRGTVADTRLAGILQDILARCRQMQPEAITYGLLAAAKAKADSSRYVAVAAGNYSPDTKPARQPQIDLGEEEQRAWKAGRG